MAYPEIAFHLCCSSYKLYIFLLNTWAQIIQFGLFIFFRTVEDCKTKWKNEKAKAKKGFQEMKRYENGTGGGPPLPPMTPSDETIIEVYGQTPSFAGIPGGFATSPIDGGI